MAVMKDFGQLDRVRAPDDPDIKTDGSAVWTVITPDGEHVAEVTVPIVGILELAARALRNKSRKASQGYMTARRVK